MRPRNLVTLGVILLAIIILTGACSAGFIAGRTINTSGGLSLVQLPELPSLETTRPSVTQSAPQALTPAEQKKLFEPFWQAWDLVHKEYVDQPVDDEALMRGAIRGMMESLGDPHTSYMDPDQTKEFSAHLNGEEYEGIGAWVDSQAEFLTIISPMPGSPAEKAGLLPGDQIVGVNGKDMTGIDGELVRQQVIGPKGSKVTLTIRREGREDTFDVVVERASITTPTILTRMEKNNVAYIRLYTFGSSTTEDLRKALKDVMAKKPAGLILDLRYNGGGYLETAIDVASQFIDNGVIMYEEYGDGRRTTYRARSGGLATDIPMIVLINEGSASASEIVAGAIQDSGRGRLVGVTSYGKGSVQSPTELVNDEGAVRITIARWLTPKERQINQVGLTPDVVVEISDADAQAGRDPQLDKAIELLSVQQ